MFGPKWSCVEAHGGEHVRVGGFQGSNVCWNEKVFFPSMAVVLV